MNDAPVEIIVIPLDASLRALGAGTGRISRAEHDRARGFRLEIDRRRYIAAHMELRMLLGARSGLPPQALQLDYGRNGKPTLKGSSVEFSLSRSAGLAAYAFTHARPVGIDVEAIRPVTAADEIAERSFPRFERQAYAALSGADRLPGFFRGWTRTEALAKALGGGLALPQEALDAALQEGWAVHTFAPAPGFAGAVACGPAGRC